MARRLAAREGSSGRWGRAIAVVTAVALALGPATASAGACGAWFTLGFKGSNETFVILARGQKAIDELRADLSKPRSDRRIVSGVVRTGTRYNHPWSFTMGPRSIVLGQTFIEVCDASPSYVETHRSDWLGHRWCPWSSYVKHAGR